MDASPVPKALVSVRLAAAESAVGQVTVSVVPVPFALVIKTV